MKKNTTIWMLVLFTGFGSVAMAKAPEPGSQAEAHQERFLQMTSKDGLSRHQGPHKKKISGTVNKSLKPGSITNLKK